MSTQSLYWNDLYELWSTTPFTAPVAAGAAIMPLYRGFVKKNTLQVDEKYEPCRDKVKLVKGAVGAGLEVGAIAGTQIIAKSLCEYGIAKTTQLPKDDTRVMLAATLVTSVASSPLLAMFNGNRMEPPIPWRSSLRSFAKSPHQMGAIVIQEFGFLGGVTMGAKIKAVVQPKLGDSEWVACASYFTSGALGAALGHGGNTYLALQQKKLPWKTWRQLALGMGVRSVTVGAFAVLLEYNMKGLEHIKKEYYK